MSSTALLTREEFTAENARQAGALSIRSHDFFPSDRDMNVIKQLANWAGHAQGSGIVPAHIKTPAQAAVIMLYGYEQGLRPMTALQHVFIVNGRAALSGQAMMGIVLARCRGAKFIFHETSAKKADIELQIPGNEPLRLSYTIEEAQKSGQATKQGPWIQYTQDMLRWHVIKRLCRFGAADFINGIDGIDVSGRIMAADAMDSGPAPAQIESAEIPADAYNEGDKLGVPVDPEATFAEPVELELTPPEPQEPLNLQTWPLWKGEHQMTTDDITDCILLSRFLGRNVPNLKSVKLEEWAKIERDYQPDVFAGE